MDDEFRRSINYLKNSPLFAMSLSSKELFHSNFWKWIIDQEYGKDFIKTFFPDFNSNTFKRAEREDHHRDLVIYDKENHEYVIENKIKSYADYSQLEKYSKETNLECGVVTGIKKPPFKLPEKWRFVTYFDIAQGIKKLIPAIKNDFGRKLLEEYAQVIFHIDFIMEYALSITDGQLIYNNEQLDVLNDIRMMDVFRKLKADEFALYCEGIMDEIRPKLNTEDGWECKVDRSFNNTNATLSFYLQRNVLNNEKEKEYKGEIGVQIEGKQFRLFLGITKNRNPNKQQVFDYGVDLGWFNPNYNKKMKNIIDDLTSSMEKSYCSYSNRWVYQYFDIVGKDENRNSYALLKEYIRYYLNKALHIINNNPKIREIFK